MNPMLKHFYARPLAVYLAAALLVISTFAGPAEAMYLTVNPHASAAAGTSSPQRIADLGKVQTVLESKVIQQRLMDYGLSADEAAAKLNGLSDEQLHQLASNMDSLQAGGDAVGAVVGLLIIALLVVLLIYLLEGRIEVKRR